MTKPEIKTKWYLGIETLNDGGGFERYLFEGWLCQDYDSEDCFLDIHSSAFPFLDLHSCATPFDSKNEGLDCLKRSQIMRDYKGARIVFNKITTTSEQGELGTL